MFRRSVVLAILIVCVVGLLGFAEEDVGDGSVPYPIDTTIPQRWECLHCICPPSGVYCGPCINGYMECAYVTWWPRGGFRDFHCRPRVESRWTQRCDDVIPRPMWIDVTPL